MKAADKSLAVGGYLFQNETDASLARIEQQKIAYIEARIDYSSPESVRYVYEKAIQEKLFKTPVGLRYVKQLQEFLLHQPEISEENIMDIPLQAVFDEEILAQKAKRREKALVHSRELEGLKKNGLTISVAINVILALAVAAMFYITIKSDQPNVLNYERAVLNKYAAWQQELTEREQIIREKELELKIQR